MTIELRGIGKVTAEPEVLNSISIWAFEASNQYETAHTYSLARVAKEASGAIFAALDSVGYYK